VILRPYLPFISENIFTKAFEDKISRTRRPETRARLENKRPVFEKHLQVFFESLDNDQLLSVQVLESVHQVGELCRKFCTRDQVMMENLRTGRAFERLGGVQSEGSVVWDLFETSIMKGKHHPLQIVKRRKPSK
jgi:hypothetical protein